ncbi:MAG: hypothetical protein ACK55I_01925, partial [bacterium]
IDGCDEGFEGILLGCDEGSPEGCIDGSTVGWQLGFEDGCIDGCDEGFEGILLGCDDGSEDGCIDGS